MTQLALQCRWKQSDEKYKRWYRNHSDCGITRYRESQTGSAEMQGDRISGRLTVHVKRGFLCTVMYSHRAMRYPCHTVAKPWVLRGRVHHLKPSRGKPTCRLAVSVKKAISARGSPGPSPRVEPPWTLAMSRSRITCSPAVMMIQRGSVKRPG